jgi:thiosulfate dehydrogenase
MTMLSAPPSAEPTPARRKSAGLRHRVFAKGPLARWRHSLWATPVSRVVLLGVLLATASSSGCGPLNGREVGASLFRDPRTSRSTFNAVSCATCHDDGTAPPTALLPGGSLVGAVFRPSWWGGQAGSLKQAVDDCLVHFMRERPFAHDDPRGRALYEYLLSLSEAKSAPAVPVTIVENVTTLGKGDARRGAKIWAQACASCHGALHTGEGRLHDLVSLVPEASAAFAAESGFPLELVIIEKVRHGGFFGVGGSMPPYSLEVLADDDLRDLLGYVLEHE